MEFLQLTERLLRDIDFAKTEIIRPKRMIFLCGGKTKNEPGPSPSLRESVLRHLPIRTEFGDFRILLAERAVEALARSEFTNLLDLEECIAAVVDAIVLIVESPGSICELGAFSKTVEIASKLITIVPNEYANVPSFITEGAIAYLRDEYKSEPLPYHWTYADDTGATVAQHVLEDITQAVPDAVRNVYRKEVFKRGALGHRIYLTMTFCHILRGAKLGEIESCFEWIGIKISQKEIRKHIDTLEICGFVRTVKNGLRRTHYVSLHDRIPILAAFKDNTEDKQRNIMRRLQGIAAAISAEDKTRMTIFQEHNNAA